MLRAMAGQSKGIMRSLGEFFGHIARGIATDPAGAAKGGRTVVRDETTEGEGTTADGRRVILRRTVVEEVELVPDGRCEPAAERGSDDETQKGNAP